MLRVLVCVSGGGTNLQAIIDAGARGELGDTGIVRVISNNPNAYALERAKNAGIDAVCVSPKEFANRADFHKALLDAINEAKPDLIVLAGFLVVVPEEVIAAYRNRIINIHPSLIPSFTEYACFSRSPQVASVRSCSCRRSIICAAIPSIQKYLSSATASVLSVVSSHSRLLPSSSPPCRDRTARKHHL